MTASITGGQVALLFLVLMRCIGLVMTAPIFGHHSIPTPVKFGLAAMLTIVLANERRRERRGHADADGRAPSSW